VFCVKNMTSELMTVHFQLLHEMSRAFSSVSSKTYSTGRYQPVSRIRNNFFGSGSGSRFYVTGYLTGNYGSGSGSYLAGLVTNPFSDPAIFVKIF